MATSFGRRLFSTMVTSRPGRTNPSGRHVLWSGAAVVGIFAACAVAERRRPTSADPRWRRMRWPADRPARGLVLIEHESVLERVKRKWDASSETTRTLTVLTAANAAVFGLWHVRAPAIRRVLERYFTSRPESRRIVPHLLSGFSHQSGAHLAFNMIALWSVTAAAGWSIVRSLTLMQKVVRVGRAQHVRPGAVLLPVPVVDHRQLGVQPRLRVTSGAPATIAGRIGRRPGPRQRLHGATPGRPAHAHLPAVRLVPCLGGAGRHVRVRHLRDPARLADVRPRRPPGRPARRVPVRLQAQGPDLGPAPLAHRPPWRPAGPAPTLVRHVLISLHDMGAAPSDRQRHRAAAVPAVPACGPPTSRSSLVQFAVGRSGRVGGGSGGAAPRLQMRRRPKKTREVRTRNDDDDDDDSSSGNAVKRSPGVAQRSTGGVAGRPGRARCGGGRRDAGRRAGRVQRGADGHLAGAVAPADQRPGPVGHRVRHRRRRRRRVLLRARRLAPAGAETHAALLADAARPATRPGYRRSDRGADHVRRAAARRDGPPGRPLGHGAPPRDGVRRARHAPGRRRPRRRLAAMALVADARRSLRAARRRPERCRRCHLTHARVHTQYTD